MAYNWTDDLQTGNVQIDTEHKRLINATNELLEACSKGKGRDELQKTIDFLLSYTRTHFANEEALQKKYNYPDYINHKKYHQDFLTYIGDLHKRLSTNGASIALVGEVNLKLGNWLVKHIKTEDVKVAAHIKKQSK